MFQEAVLSAAASVLLALICFTTVPHAQLALSTFITRPLRSTDVFLLVLQELTTQVDRALLASVHVSHVRLLNQLV